MFETKSKILLTGGGTLGSVTPLLALANRWKEIDPAVEFSWIGTPSGPERELIEQNNITFYSLSTPKLDRHRIWIWLFIAPHFVYSLIRACLMLRKIKPDMVFTAGGYVSVPIVTIAWTMRIPSWVHQLDVKPGLANKIMAPFAKRVSVTWPASARAFAQNKTSVVGGLVREKLSQGDPVSFKNKYHLDLHKPTLLILGGGTGALAINEAMMVIAQEIASLINVVHLTGIGKMPSELKGIKNYVTLEFLKEEMADAYAAADFVVARAGMGTILEIVALQKPTILIPIENSHQMFNAQELSKLQAAIVIEHLTPQILKQEIKRLVSNLSLRIQLTDKISSAIPMNAADKIISEAQGLIKKQPTTEVSGPDS